LVCSAARICTDSGGTPDASPAFECPASYDLALPRLSGPSRYRLITTGAQAWQQSDTCAQDLPGATHLVVLETSAELASVQALVDHPPAAIVSTGVWVGGVQLSIATRPGDGWLSFDRRPLIAGHWFMGTGENGLPDAEPNDGGNSTDKELEQFVTIEFDRSGLQDSDGRNNKGALCECDGKPIAAPAAGAVDGYRQSN
jgi:hypothetical protein